MSSARAYRLCGYLALASLAACHGRTEPCPGGCLAGLSCNTATAGCEGNFSLVGQSHLFNRGMNAALAVRGSYVYVGSRTDGPGHSHSGVLVVDASDPTQPQVVGEIGPPEEGLLGMSSRELRVWPEKNLLIVLNIACGLVLHDCSQDVTRFPQTGGVAEHDNLKFFDLTDPVNPRLVGRYDFGTFPPANNPGTVGAGSKPHEFFLWKDPRQPARALLYVSTPSDSPDLQVLDISNPAAPVRIATWDTHDNGGLDEDRATSYLHSLSISDDGTVGYLAAIGGGFFMIDTSALAHGSPSPTISLLTPMAQRVDYAPPSPPGTHSAVAVPGRPLVVLTDEIYPVEVQYGCPWGWGRLVDVGTPARPALLSEFKLPQNDPSRCDELQRVDVPSRVTYSSHNPTVTRDLIIVTWHSAGLQVFDSSDPLHPVQVGAFLPPLADSVATEDPALGGNPVTMWSYPVIQNGLIYVTDIRNGLSIVKYTGPHHEETEVSFLEGNSNLK